MTDLAKREAVYEKLRPFLWGAVDKRTGLCSIRSGVMGNVFDRHMEPTGPFTFSPTRPPPTYAGSNGPINGHVPPRDFPSPDYEWGHPSFMTYMHGYAMNDKKLAERMRDD